MGRIEKNSLATFNTDILEPQEGIFEFSVPQRIDTEEWTNTHLEAAVLY